MSNVNRRKTPCVLAGDFNIDLSNIDVNVDTLNYVDMVLTNNFTPIALMPTRITSKSCTLIDHYVLLCRRETSGGHQNFKR